MSDSLRKAWVEAKAARLDERLFALDMIDRQSADDKDLVRKLGIERSEILASIDSLEDTRNSVQAAPSGPKMIENPYLSAEEKAEIEAEMFTMMTKGIYDGTFSMEAYKALESRLFIEVVEAVA